MPPKKVRRQGCCAGRALQRSSSRNRRRGWPEGARSPPRPRPPPRRRAHQRAQRGGLSPCAGRGTRGRGPRAPPAWPRGGGPRAPWRPTYTRLVPDWPLLFSAQGKKEKKAEPAPDEAAEEAAPAPIDTWAPVSAARRGWACAGGGARTRVHASQAARALQQARELGRQGASARTRAGRECALDAPARASVASGATRAPLGSGALPRRSPKRSTHARALPLPPDLAARSAGRSHLTRLRSPLCSPIRPPSPVLLPLHRSRLPNALPVSGPSLRSPSASWSSPTTSCS